MPAHNAANTLADSIRSVQAQSHRDWELLITNDGSSDKTAEILEAFAAEDERIRIFSFTEGRGAAAARNQSIANASGSFIAFLDSDDLWLPQKLEKQLAFMAEKQLVLSYTSYSKIDEKGGLASSQERYVRCPRRMTYQRLLLNNDIGCLTAMYDAERLGIRLMPEILRRQDYGLWLSILKEGHVALGLDECLALYRQTSSGLSGNKPQTALFNWKLYRDVEKLPLWRAVYCFANYMIRSAWKHAI